MSKHITVKPKKGKLCVQSDGRRCFISVPAGQAIDLHNYLRTNRVRSAPPEPCYTGVDNIELEKDVDIESIQALLNLWKGAAPERASS